MITKEHAIDICRDLGFSLNSQHLQYFQCGYMFDLNTDGLGGYYYVGFVSPANSFHVATDEPFDITVLLRGAIAQTWSVGDMVYDVALDSMVCKRMVDSVKFVVFDQITSPNSCNVSFYGYRFKK